ncbi:hypothetical protein SDC9_166867 [bioreactor metagenome]|uniref:Uncharacterized protein n=1 Tax=bioreactor metagenome TaxID=1076179 RepID=A0A645G016_9ZZZZ
MSGCGITAQARRLAEKIAEVGVLAGEGRARLGQRAGGAEQVAQSGQKGQNAALPGSGFGAGEDFRHRLGVENRIFQQHQQHPVKRQPRTQLQLLDRLGQQLQNIFTGRIAPPQQRRDVHLDQIVGFGRLPHPLLLRAVGAKQCAPELLQQIEFHRECGTHGCLPPCYAKL